MEAAGEERRDIGKKKEDGNWQRIRDKEDKERCKTGGKKERTKRELRRKRCRGEESGGERGTEEGKRKENEL